MQSAASHGDMLRRPGRNERFEKRSFLNVEDLKNAKPADLLVEKIGEMLWQRKETSLCRT